MDKQFGRDFSKGSIPKHLLSFSIPMLLGNLIQISYNLINIIWVGHLVGENAVGAVGISFPILFILIGFAMGITLATTILVSQYYGARDYAMVKKVVSNSFSLPLIVGVILTFACILLRNFLLELIKTPPENFAMASSYLRIMLLSFILTYTGFLISSILRGIGDTMTPLIFMAIGVGLNAILDPLLIGGFGPFPRLGLNGAAYATLISQAVALSLAFTYLNWKNHLVAFHPREVIFDRHLTFLVFKIGVPSIIQQSLVSIGAMFVTTFVNSFGSAATNAFGAVGRVDMVVIMPAVSMSMAVAALTGQNLGAGKPDRVKEVFKSGVVMTSFITIFISLMVVFLSRFILTLFGLGEDTKVMEIGITYLRIVGSSYLFFAVMFISNGVINGAGHTMTTMVFTLVSLWLVRVPVSWWLSKTSLGITGVWIAIALSFLTTMTVSLAYYFSGRWKKSPIIKEPAAVPAIG